MTRDHAASVKARLLGKTEAAERFLTPARFRRSPPWSPMRQRARGPCAGGVRALVQGAEGRAGEIGEARREAAQRRRVPVFDHLRPKQDRASSDIGRCARDAFSVSNPDAANDFVGTDTDAAGTDADAIGNAPVVKDVVADIPRLPREGRLYVPTLAEFRIRPSSSTRPATELWA